MKYKSLLALAIVPLILTGCIGQSKEPELTPEELEHMTFPCLLSEPMTENI